MVTFIRIQLPQSRFIENVDKHNEKHFIGKPIRCNITIFILKLISSISDFRQWDSP